MEGSNVDVADFIDLWPSEEIDGEIKRPKVVRGALKINGGGVGFEDKAITEVFFNALRLTSDMCTQLIGLIGHADIQTLLMAADQALRPAAKCMHHFRH